MRVRGLQGRAAGRACIVLSAATRIGSSQLFVRLLVCAASESVELDHVLDPSGAAEKEIAVRLHWKAPGD
jgi:hypothetical protein